MPAARHRGRFWCPQAGPELAPGGCTAGKRLPREWIRLWKGENEAPGGFGPLPGVAERKGSIGNAWEGGRALLPMEQGASFRPSVRPSRRLHSHACSHPLRPWAAEPHPLLLARLGSHPEGWRSRGVFLVLPIFPPSGFFICHGSGERAAGLEQEAARGGQGLVPSSGGCGLSVPPPSASSTLLAAASSKGRPGLCTVLDTSPSLGWCRGDRGCHRLCRRWHRQLTQDPNKATKRGFRTQMK